MKIKDLYADERPREKMRSLGPEAMSNGELMAILLRSGNPGESALSLAQRLIAESGNSLAELYRMCRRRSLGIKGIGPCKMAQIQAALELGRRFMDEKSGQLSLPVNGPRAAFEKLLPKMKGLDHEECWILLLASSMRIIDRVRLSSGGGVSTIIDLKQIMRTAVDRKASAIVLAHNHPSGNPRPSEADIERTRQIKEAAKAFDLCLTDHIIVCDSSYFSFAEDRVFFL